MEEKLNKHIVFLLLWLMPAIVFAQGYDTNRIELANFIERMYDNEPFEGCRIVEDYDNSYLLSVVLLDKSKYPSPIAMNRVAQVKSQRNAGEFFNGTQSYSELIIRMPKSKGKDKKEIVEVVEEIRVNSTGFVHQMQLLTSFERDDNQKIFIFYKELKGR